MNFPQKGDAFLYENLGKKHYQNHSDKLLKIVLPRQYALQNPIAISKEKYYPPHLERHLTELSSENPAGRVRSYQSDNIKSSIRGRVEDELDKMYNNFENQRRERSENRLSKNFIE